MDGIVLIDMRRQHVIKKILRMKLTDFMNTDIEDMVFYFLNTIKSEIPNFIVHCWYNQNEITDLQLSEFKNKYIDSINKLEMTFYIIYRHEYSVWYDIINKKDSENLNHYKFRSIYETPDQLITSIIEFNNVIKFDNQKNNSNYIKNGNNVNGKNSNNGFKTLGKQTQIKERNICTQN